MRAGKIFAEMIKARALGLTIVFMLIMPIALGGVAGFFLDKALGTMPIFFLILICMGLVASARTALKFKL
ncbi:MAG TPA: AtpZ/AtpI family protein [Caldisericia bacterium]|nr:AtpZ/AtpI family protein [Caldisericia bacterium]MCE5177191.1 AtpZ/AtpI family protein [bacterium]NMD14324.1 AtpZ/AtpI family protein [Caldisericales bacterium]MBP6927996.1 AtpZ/AtpI family protein [Caldisericia bacterium]HNW31856.1 AtpZ/AtpI family protein [Caldisericia bacterium]